MNSANWLKWLGYTHEFVTPSKLRTHIPSLPLTGFGSWGTSEKFSPWHLMKLNDSVELGTAYSPTNDTRIRMMFSLSCRIEIDKSFYDMEYPKYPLIMDKEKLYIRRASQCERATLYHPDLIVPYVTITDVGVNVDPETRRPTPFPDSWKAKFGVPTEMPNMVNKAGVTGTKPRLNVVKTHIQVSFSETDENNHTNYSEYLKFSYNSFCENMLNHKHRSDVRHLFNGGVKMAEMTFKKESLLGDILSVESWEDADNSDTYHFEVNKGETLCCFVTLQFFSCNSHSKL